MSSILCLCCGKNSVRAPWRPDAGDGLWHLRWQTELLSLEYFCDVQVEEVAVQNGLDNASHHSNEVKEALEVEAPDPVDEIQSAVEAQEEQVVGGDGLRLPCFADHEELGKDSHGFQVDGEGPQNLERREIVID